jgi:hypothetical protein
MTTWKRAPTASSAATAPTGWPAVPGTDEIQGGADRDTFYNLDSMAEQVDREPDEPLAEPPPWPPIAG